MKTTMHVLFLNIILLVTFHSCEATPLLTEVKQFPHTGGYTLGQRHLFVGNVEESSNGKSKVGSVTLYPRYGTEIDYSSGRKIVPFDGESNDRFGYYITVNSEYILIQSPGDDGKGTIYVYENNIGLTFKQKLVANGWSMQHANYHASYININTNNDVVVGCEGCDNNLGAAYVFNYATHTKTWDSPQKLTPQTRISGAKNFGCNAVISSGIIAIAQRHTGNTQRRVYVFQKSGTTWTEVQILSPVQSGTTSFGERMTMSEEHLFVSSPHGNLNYLRIYEQRNGMWTLVQSVKGSGPWYANAIAVDKNILVSGVCNGMLSGLNTGFVLIHEYNRATRNWEEKGRLALSDRKDKDCLSGWQAVLSENLVTVSSSWMRKIVAVFDVSSLVSYRPPPPPAPWGRDQLTCHANTFEAALAKSSFPENPLNMEVQLNDPSCTNFTTNNRSHVVVIGNFTSCGSSVSERNDVVAQGNTITVIVTYNEGGLRFRRNYIYRVQCRFNKYRNVSSTPIISILQSVTEKTLDKHDEFKIELTVFTSSTFNVRASNPYYVNPSDPLFVSIAEEYELFTFVVNECYIAPTTGVNNNMTTTFFSDKCPQHASFAILTSDNKVFQFRIDTFDSIVDAKSVQIHCRVHVCLLNDTSTSCQRNCTKSRKRRNIATPTEHFEVPIKTLVLHSQEIIIVQSCKGESCSQQQRKQDKYGYYIGIIIALVVVVVVLAGVIYVRYHNRVRVQPDKSGEQSAAPSTEQ